MNEFEKELSELINRYSKENDSNTPDFLLAEYLTECLNTFSVIMKKRDKWYGGSAPPELYVRDYKYERG
jgi:hypothetical protein